MSPQHRFSFATSLSYVVVILVLALPSAFAIGYARMAAHRRDHVTAEHTLDAARAVRLHVSAEKVTAAARGYLLAGDDAFLAKMKRARADFDGEMGVLVKRTHRPEGTELLERVNRAAERYDASVDRVAAVRDATTAEGRAALNHLFAHDMMPQGAALDEALGAYIDYREEVIGVAARAAEHAFDRALAVSAGAFVLALLASVALGLRFAQSLASSHASEREALHTAEAAVAARDDMLGVVAHDLRSPLAAISMKAGLIRRSGDREVAIRQARSIEDVAERMESLIQTLLEAASIEAGRLPVSPSPTSVRSLLDDVVDVFGSQAAARSVGLSVRLDDPDLQVMADPERVDQVLSNLVGNALKFTPAGGQVVIAASKQDGQVRFAVVDDGPGVPSDDAKRVFDRFWQAERRGGRGSGLGLYIARGIVEAHQGRIWVDSEPGSGAAFCFTLPCPSFLGVASFGV
jgi:signal transduction histidine kinase